MTIYDINRTISPELAVWPGSDAFSFQMRMQITQGDSVNLTALSLTPHTASHADAGWHTSDTGLKAHELPLEKYLGSAQVVTIDRQEGAIIPDDLRHAITTPLERLLIHTWVSDVPDERFPHGFPYPSVDLIDWLADQGAALLGLDSPSVDDFTSKDLPGHHRLRQRDMVHLESLQLTGVPDGHYELIALPLKIKDVCGSPVRAILRTVE